MSSSRDQRRQLYERLVGTDVAEGRYTITALLGFGGMGAVYEAIQQNMDRKVALKLIPTHDPTIVARFEREAFTISKLRHPNTVTVFDFGQGDDGFLFLAMELLDGKTLSEVIADGPISSKRAVHITSQICRSLGEAHRSGIVHRDIKPDNIILIRVDQDRDFVKVLDFGIAKAVIGEDDVQLTGDGRIIGTPRYMSPEQILAEPLDHRSDIYSLGCILYEMLCGAPPFEQSSTTALMISHTQDPPPSFSQRLDGSKLDAMPRAIEQVVRRALAKSPSNRHQDTDELREELEAAIEGRLSALPVGEFESESTAGAIPSSMRPMTGERPVPQHITQSNELAKPAGTTAGSKTGLLAGAILLVLIVIGGLVAYQIFGGTSEPVEPATGQEEGAVAAPGLEDEPGDVEEIVEPLVEKPAKAGYLNLVVRGKPAGALVKVDDVEVGKTPIVFPIEMDRERVNVVLSKEGYHDFQAVIAVDTGQKKRSIEYQLDAVAPKPKTKRPPRTQPKDEPAPKSASREESKEAEEKAEEETADEDKPTEVDLLDVDSDSKTNVDLLVD